MRHPNHQPLTHGAEAFGTLDPDRDGEISGGDLESRSLWFDGNRDGVSDGGEVVPTSGRDVYEIYHQDSESSDASKDVHLSLFSRPRNTDASTLKPHIAPNHSDDVRGYWM